MRGLGYACAVVLAAVFVRAGAAKLARGAQTRASFAALGVPPAAAPAMPVVELAVAVALLAAPRLGAVAALVVLAAFTAVLVRAVHRRLDAPCNCFGAARAEPVSWVDVVRNGLLAAAAGLALADPRPTVPRPGALALVGLAAVAGRAVLGALRRRA